MFQENSKESTNLNNKFQFLKNGLKLLEDDNNNNDYEQCKKAIEDFIKLKKATRNVISRLVNRVEVSESHELDVYFNFKVIFVMNTINN